MTTVEKMFEVLRERYPEIDKNAEIIPEESTWYCDITVFQNNYRYSMSVGYGGNVCFYKANIVNIETEEYVFMSSYEDSKFYSSEAASILAKFKEEHDFATAELEKEREAETVEETPVEEEKEAPKTYKSFEDYLIENPVWVETDYVEVENEDGKNLLTPEEEEEFSRLARENSAPDGDDVVEEEEKVKEIPVIVAFPVTLSDSDGEERDWVRIMETTFDSWRTASELTFKAPDPNVVQQHLVFEETEEER